jgi:hypothetical protein
VDELYVCVAFRELERLPADKIQVRVIVEGLKGRVHLVLCTEECPPAGYDVYGG